MTNPERREKAKEILKSLYDYAVVSTQNSEEYDEMYKGRIDSALSALEALMPEVMTKEEVEKLRERLDITNRTLEEFINHYHLGKDTGAVMALRAIIKYNKEALASKLIGRG